jgi:RIO kinase 1
MTTYNNFELYEQLEDLENMPHIRNLPGNPLRHPPGPKRRQKKFDPLNELAEQENELQFSYQAAKHEQAWLIESLKDFYYQQWFDDILRLIKGGGKEASVYQCLANQTTGKTYLAAKVYRPRKFRQLRNDALYREGRLYLDDAGHEITDDGALHAIQQRTTFGLQLLHTSWIEHEFQTMTLLHRAGADVPEPLVSGNNAILMAYIGWDDLPAPTLNTVKLPQREARQIFDQVIHNVEIMLANQRVHGDLSAYNILYLEGEIYLIDFPQAIDPVVNRNAYAIFKRDLTRLCEYFQDQGLSCDPCQLAESLWQKHGYPVRPSIDPRLMPSED